MNTLQTLQDKNILLLQGPMGDFFTRLEAYFQQKGAKTFRIGFNAGDWFFSAKDNYTPFKAPKHQWQSFITTYLQEQKIDMIFLFGDCRYYQSIAIKVAQQLNVETYVFEEGYVRPDYVTLEKWGVNNFSLIPRDATFYKHLEQKELPKPLPTHPSYFKMAMSATFYYLFAYFGKIFYPHYEHHRELNPFKEAFYGIRSWWRKFYFKWSERDKLQKILKQRYYFVPLQTSSDFQIKTHSSYKSIEEFIEEVLNSFAKFAPLGTTIVFKHHPMDRGRKLYNDFIQKKAKKLNIANRVEVVYDLHLPTLLKSTLATITINSTVGLQALYHKSPLKVMGNAIYDIEGLTYQKDLDSFWTHAQEPDYELFEKFRTYLIQNTQVNGSFYGYFAFEEL